MDQIAVEQQAVRLPLWKSCLEAMERDGIHYGKTYDAAFFEQRLKVPRDSMKFGLDVSEIRRALEEQGFYLSGRGQKGNLFVILPPESNAAVLAGYESQSRDALKRAMMLGTATKLDGLTDPQKKRHERALERVAVRIALTQKAARVYRYVKAKAPKLLNGKG